MKKWIWWVIIIIVLVLAGIWYYNKSATPVSGEPIKIGVILPLTGGAAFLGENGKNGMEMAVKELAFSTNREIFLIFEDDQFDAAKTVSTFKKLTEVDKVNYVITMGSSGSNAVGPLAQEAKVVQIAVSTDPKVLEYGFSVKNGSDPVALGKKTAEEVVKRKYEKVFILASNHEGVLSIVREFEKLPEVKGKIIGRELIDPSESDFKSVLVKVKQAKPDAILLEILPGKVGLAAKQARQLGITQPFFASVVFEDQASIASAGGALEGQWYSNSSVSDNFINQYKNIYSKVPSREAGNGYDSIVLLERAIGLAGDNPVKVNKYLHTLTSFDSGSIYGGTEVVNGNFINSAAIKTIKNGQFVPLEN